MVVRHLNLERWWQQVSSADLRKELAPKGLQFYPSELFISYN